jgi:hypothetical protein
MIVTFLGVLNAAAERAAPRTDFSRNPETAAVIALPVDPDIVIPDMIDPRDASVTYRHAAEQVLFKQSVYENFARAGQPADIEEIPAVKILLEAAYTTDASFFDQNPSLIINYDNDKPMLDALRTLGQCARRVGMLIEEDQPAEAMKHYEAAFSLGIKLFNERITYDELSAGLTLMAENARLIAALADKQGQSTRAAAARRFDTARIAWVNQYILPVQQVLSSADPHIIERHAGDVIYLAHHAPERMWRVEAILRLGRYRFHSETLGDQRIASRIIHQLTTDPDPIIRTAAAAARDLTVERYRLMR